jgi:hypothetical protein
MISIDACPRSTQAVRASGCAEKCRRMPHNKPRSAPLERAPKRKRVPAPKRQHREPPTYRVRRNRPRTSHGCYLSLSERLPQRRSSDSSLCRVSWPRATRRRQRFRLRRSLDPSRRHPRCHKRCRRPRPSQYRPRRLHHPCSHPRRHCPRRIHRYRSHAQQHHSRRHQSHRPHPRHRRLSLHPVPRAHLPLNR